MNARPGNAELQLGPFPAALQHLRLPTTPHSLNVSPMNELVFEVTPEVDGGYVAEAQGEGVITQADTWEELRKNDREAMSAYFFDRFPLVRNLKINKHRADSFSFLSTTCTSAGLRWTWI